MSNKQKILYVQHSGANGGAPMSLFYLLEYVKKEYEVCVYFISDGPAVDFYRKSGINVIVDTRLGKMPHCTIENQCLNPFVFKFYSDLRRYFRHYLKLIPTYFRMRKILKYERPNIVHLNSSVLISEGLAVKSLNIPLVWHLRDFIDYGNFKIRYTIIRNIINYSSSEIIALCESELSRVTNLENGHVIPNFVNLTKFDYNMNFEFNLRKELSIDNKTKIVAMLGWNTPAKGAMNLLKAFCEIKDKHQNCVLVFFGEGPKNVNIKNKLIKIKKCLFPDNNLKDSLDSIITTNSLSKRVMFPGVYFNIAECIQQSNIIVVPFIEPHFARPILEAGAMKTVVLTSDIDGTREMVQYGRAGYLANPQDYLDLAKKLDLALTNNNIDMVELMYQNTIRNYNAEINAKKTIACYMHLIPDI